jgi:hypothetical protein
MVTHRWEEQCSQSFRTMDKTTSCLILIKTSIVLTPQVHNITQQVINMKEMDQVT